MKIIEELKNFGLFDSEIKVYLYLIEHGISTPREVAKATKIERSNTYNILSSLKSKGLVEEKIQHKKKTFLSKDPMILVKNLELRKDSMEKILPDLNALNFVQKTKPKIHFYNGWNEVKEIFYLVTQTKEKRIYGIVSLNKLFKIDDKFFVDFRNTLRKNGIVLHDILTFASQVKAKRSREELKALFASRVLPEKFGDLPTDILIWDDKIAFMNIGSNIFGTVMINPEIAATMKMLFELSWDHLGEE
jgi:sugar-specific transcriptional regulator TrmB